MLVPIGRCHLGVGYVGFLCHTSSANVRQSLDHANVLEDRTIWIDWVLISLQQAMAARRGTRALQLNALQRAGWKA